MQGPYILILNYIKTSDKFVFSVPKHDKTESVYTLKANIPLILNLSN